MMVCRYAHDAPGINPSIRPSIYLPSYPHPARRTAARPHASYPHISPARTLPPALLHTCTCTPAPAAPLLRYIFLSHTMYRIIATV